MTRDEREAEFWRTLRELEPACWSWPVTDEAREQVRRAKDTSLSWMDRALAEGAALRAFDQGRCALCGEPGSGRVEDHCHETGRVRGMLCRSCNTREGRYRDSTTVFGKYRRRHPYLILDMDVPYFGMGWENGVPDGGWPSGWGEPPETDAEMWANHPFRGVL